MQGGGEKRSLADIQAEQEFQEWWDAESARIQGEETKTPEKRDDKGKGYRGRRRGGEAKRREGARQEGDKGKNKDNSVIDVKERRAAQ